ncbi:MAG: hypothetical protein ACO3EZ_15585 [Prochlorotrichaceae cyanobacterium]
MTQNITLDDFYALFRESERQRQETERLIRESLEASRQEFDRDLAKSRAEFKQDLAESRAKSEQDLAESRAKFEQDLAESRAKSEQDLAESRAEFDRRFAKTERIAAQANEAVSNLSSRWGRFVENLVAPAAIRLFQDRGILVDRTHQRMRARQGNQHLEIDIFAVNYDVGVVIEVKSRLTQEHVRKFLEKLSIFKTIFTEYKNHQLYGALAAIEIDGDVDTYAENQGLFIIQQSGDSVYISTDREFSPRTW